jgi:flagellar FliL protein
MWKEKDGTHGGFVPVKEDAMPERDKAPIEEEEIEQPKKGGGKKLFVLLFLVVILGGGGFFAMKAKLGKGKTKVELGEIVPLPEILVNLKDPNTYARTEISLHFKKGFEKTKFDANVDAVRDAVILKLSSKSLKEVRTLEGKLALKKEIAAVINRALADPSKNGSSASGSEHSDWDSDTGPVLKVYFANFATQ